MPAPDEFGEEAPQSVPESFETAVPVQVQRKGAGGAGAPADDDHRSASAPGDSGESIELQVLGACLVEGSDVYERATDQGIRASNFIFPHHGRLWSIFGQLGTDINILVPELAGRNGDSGELIRLVMQASGQVPSTTRADHFIDRLLDLGRRSKLERLAARVIERTKAGDDVQELLADLAEQTEVLADSGKKASRAEQLKALHLHRVRASAPPKEPVTRLFLAGKPIATPGNLVTLISRAKTGKTATIGAAVAAIIAAHHDRPDLDTLKFTAPHTREAVVLIDTEQSPYDAYTCYQRAMKRANQPTDPDWLHHYALVGYSAQQLREALPLLLADARSKSGGIFMLILDGVADFVDSVNDEAECNAYIAALRALSVEFDCPILCVIHSNEAIKSGDDGRGHLGKQLTRKAESNLLLKKTGDTTIITSEKQRKAPITESDKVAFKWSDEQQMHILCELAEPPAKGGRPAQFKFDEFLSCFAEQDGKPKTRSVLAKFAEDKTGVKETTFKDILYRAVKDGRVLQTGTKSGYYYSLPAPS